MNASREWQEQQVEALGRANAPYAAFMLDHAREFRIVPETFKGRRMKPKMCFENTVRLVMREPWLTYCEGYVNAIIPIHHAWAVTDKGEVVDPTLSLKGVNGTARSVKDYFGVPFDRQFVGDFLRTVRRFGLLDGMSQMSADLIMGKIPPERFIAHEFRERATQ